MHHTHRIAAILALGWPIVALAQNATHLIPQCGYLNGPSCGVVDYEYWNSGIAKACDFGLADSSGVCVMGQSRESLPFDQSWVVWALNNQQRYSIGLDLQMDQIPTLGTHNSYSSYRQGFASDMSTDQVLSITDQLQWGMRIIRLDPAWYYGNWHVCHGDATACQTPAISSNRLFAYAVQELADWLNAHPGEVIYLIINGHDGDDTSDWVSMLDHYIGQTKFFTPADYTSNGGWPTMRYMLANQKQIIMMSFHQMGALGFAYDGGVVYGLHTSDPGFAQCKSQPPSCTTTDCEVDIRTRQPGVDSKGHLLPIFVEGGEDRTGSVATSGWGLMDESQVQTAVQCGYSMVELDFANFLPLAYPDFVEERADTRREAAVWSWAPGDYGTAGPATMRFLDGRWVSQPTGTRLQYACETDLSDPTTQPEGVHRYRTWNVTTQSGPWTNGQTACTAEFPGSTFSYPRNGYENSNLRQVVVSKGANSGVWLNYSVIGGGSGLIVTTNPVTVVQNSSSPGTITFDVSTSVPVPSGTGVVLSFTIDLGDGSQLIENTITTQSTLRTFVLPNSWLTQATGFYNKKAKVSIRSVATGATLAEDDNVPFNINVVATSTTTITSVQSPVPEGTKSIFTVGVKSNGGSVSGSQLGVVTVYELVTQADGETVPVTIAGPLDPLIAQSVSVLLPPGAHQVGAKFVSLNTLLQSSSSSMITQGVVGYINPSPNSLSFTMDQGGALPPPQSFSGQSAVQPPLITALSWVGPIQTSGNGTNFTTQIGITPAAQQFTPGIYNGVITADDFAHVTAPVAVSLTVRAPLALSTTSITAVTSGTVYTTEVDLTKGGATPSLNLQFPGGHPNWLTVNTMPQPSNISLMALLVSFNPAGYAPGNYNSSVVVSSPIGSNTVTLNFTMQVVPLVTIDANVPGVTATVDGKAYSLPQTFTWIPFSLHTISTSAVQSGPMLQRRFDSWSSGTSISQTIIAPALASQTNAWHASFHTLWQVQSSVAPSLSGSIQFNPVSSDGFYPDGSQLTVTERPSNGYSFSMFTGDVNGAGNPQTLTINRGYDFAALFVRSPEPVTIASVPAGLNVNVDGAAYQTPQTFQWSQGSAHTVTFAQTIPGAAGVQYLFQNWADSSTAPLSRSITVSASAATYTANYQTQYYLTANPSPASGGSVTGAGWWNAGASATVKATAAAGYQFSNFTGDASGTNNPLSVTMDRAKTVAANFGPSGAPLLYAAASGPNSDSNGNRLVPIVLQNAGQGAALGAEIVSISNITAISGSGTVTTVNCPPAAGAPAACPWTAGNLSRGGSATVNVAFAWPSTATRIRMTVNFSANGGAYTGSTVLNVFR